MGLSERIRAFMDEHVYSERRRCSARAPGDDSGREALLRAGAGRNGLLSCVSGIVTKHAFKAWSIDRPQRSFAFRDLTDRVERESPLREVMEDYPGDATIARFTVLHGRNQAPKGVAPVDDPRGRRAMGTTKILRTTSA